MSHLIAFLPLVQSIARVCHEANAAYCHAIGDHSQPRWEMAPDWQKASACNGVAFHLAGTHTSEESHQNWLMDKLADGWKYGPVKNPALKEHPCMVPYDQLPEEQKKKDALFKAIVEALK